MGFPLNDRIAVFDTRGLNFLDMAGPIKEIFDFIGGKGCLGYVRYDILFLLFKFLNFKKKSNGKQDYLSHLSLVGVRVVKIYLKQPAYSLLRNAE